MSAVLTIRIMGARSKSFGGGAGKNNSQNTISINI